MSAEKEKVRIVVPWWPGPTEAEEDSPDYYDFWKHAESSVKRQIEDAKKEGKEFELVAPENSKE